MNKFVCVSFLKNIVPCFLIKVFFVDIHLMLHFEKKRKKLLSYVMSIIIYQELIIRS